MVMKLQIFTIKKFQGWTLIQKDDNYYPQVFLREFKYIEKKLVRHVIDDLESSSDSDDSGE